MTQNELILNHLKLYGTITPLEALNLYGCFRLGARVFDLKELGHNIITESETTKKSLYDQLHKEFDFNFDPCPAGGLWDGLALDWGSRTFCNPPYSQIKKWVKKAWEESQLGKTVVLLIPSRTDTSWWHDYCMKGEIRFIRGRLVFEGAKWNAPFPSAVVIFRLKDNGL